MPLIITSSSTAKYLLMAICAGIVFFTSSGELRATPYHVAPSPQASGDCRAQASACSLTTGLDRAGTGDDVVLADGVYTGQFRTRSNGVTIRAQNRHGATLAGGAYNLFRIHHSNITVRGIVFNGEQKGNCVEVGDTKGTSIQSHIVIEHNIMKNCQGPGIGVGGLGTLKDITDVIIRHNHIEETGWGNVGEGIYVGTAANKGGVGWVKDVQIYGNTIRKFTNDGIEGKPNTRNMDVHHNILEGQHRRFFPEPNAWHGHSQGGFTSHGSGNRIHDNIVRHAIWTGIAPLFLGDGGTAVWNNVFYDITLAPGASAISIYNAVPDTTPTAIYNNIFCNQTNYRINNKSVRPNIHDNRMDAPQSQCDAETARIMRETELFQGRYDHIPSNLRVLKP